LARRQWRLVAGANPFWFSFSMFIGAVSSFLVAVWSWTFA
jgi:hypothetical protein